MTENENSENSETNVEEPEEPKFQGRYIGGRDKKFNRHGTGKAILPNGDMYEGEYKHGDRHGRGLYVFKNGARYEGDWFRGRKHGKGAEFIYPDGSRYLGDFRRNLKYGKGIYYYVNGDTYSGNWIDDVRQGYGIYVQKLHNVTYTAMWDDGQMNGPIIIDYNGCYKYYGAFENNLPKGRGCFVFDNNKYMQHGLYVFLNQTGSVTDNSKHNLKYPVWRARSVTEFKEELLPPQPVDLATIESEVLIDILEYLERLYKEAPAEEEEKEEEEEEEDEI